MLLQPISLISKNAAGTKDAYVYKLTLKDGSKISNSFTFDVKFHIAETYIVHASANAPTIQTNGTVSTATQFKNTDSEVVVSAESVSSKDFVAGVELVGQDDNYEILNEKGVAATEWIGVGPVAGEDETVLALAKDGAGHQLYQVKGTDTVVFAVTTTGSGSTATTKYYAEEDVNETNPLNYNASQLELLYIQTVKPTTSTSDIYGDATLVKDGYTVDRLYVGATNVEEKEVKIKLYNGKNGQYLAGQTLKIEPVGAINVDATSVTTDRRGEASFKVSGKYNGNYKIYVSCGQFDFTINVQVGSAAAVSIKCTEEPTRPVDILGEKDLDEYVTFKMYDVNGNVVAPEESKASVQGWVKALNSDDDSYRYAVHTGETEQTVDATGYVAVISQPSGSKITNKDLTLVVDSNGNTTIKSKNSSP